MRYLLIILFLWKSVDLIISVLAPKFIKYLGFFSYGPEVLKYGVPDFIRALTNFDGIFYIRIALNGYSNTEQAFFPVYPILIRAVHQVIQNPIIAGVLISYVAFFIGFVLFFKYLKLTYNKDLDTPKWVLAMLLVYPTSYYFGVMYTESVFFAFFIAALYFQKKQNYLLAFLCAYLTALTRVVGIFLIFPLAFSFYHDFIASKPKKGWKEFLVIGAPVLGLFSYCTYLWQTTGDPLYFFHAQESFGAQRSTHLILPLQVVYRYIKIFITAQHNFQYFVAVLELSFYLGALTLLGYQLYKILKSKKKDYSLLGLNIFSLINIILPSLTGTLTAVPRYTLVSFSLFFALGEIRRASIKLILMTIFIVLHIVMVAYFVQGYYLT